MKSLGKEGDNQYIPSNTGESVKPDSHNFEGVTTLPYIFLLKGKPTYRLVILVSDHNLSKVFMYEFLIPKL